MKTLNIGMIGYGFMGRTHSNAFSQVNHFFDVPYRPVLKTVCARNAVRAQAFASGVRVVSRSGVSRWRVDYQPLTQATPNSASLVRSASGSCGNLLPSSKPS